MAQACQGDRCVCLVLGSGPVCGKEVKPSSYIAGRPQVTFKTEKSGNSDASTEVSTEIRDLLQAAGRRRA